MISETNQNDTQKKGYFRTQVRRHTRTHIEK